MWNLQAVPKQRVLVVAAYRALLLASLQAFVMPRDEKVEWAREKHAGPPATEREVRPLPVGGHAVVFQKCSKSLSNGAERGCFLSESRLPEWM